MIIIKKYSYPFFLYAFLFFISQRAFAHDVHLYFSPQGGAQDAIIRDLLSAQRSIDIAMYNFSSEAIYQVLEKIMTEKRNEDGTPKVKIRFLFNEASDQTKDTPDAMSKYEQSERLEKLGIDVRYVSKTMHNKFLIVDGYPLGVTGTEDFSKTILFTGSGNFSDSADRKYDENYIEVKDEPNLMTQFQKEFQLMWVYSYDFPTNETFESKEEYSGSWDHNSYFDAIFTSDNFKKTLKFPLNGKRVASTNIENAISNAKESIYVASDHFRFVGIASAINEAKKRNPNLDVRVMIDADEYATQTEQQNFMSAYQACLKNSDEEECARLGGFKMSRWLWDHDIEVRFKYYSYIFYYARDPQMHHKYVIIDGKDVWTGSYNYSISAEFKTFENLIHIPGVELQGVVDQYVGNFFKIWSLNRDLLSKYKIQVAKYNRIPLHFTSMALTLGEVDGLRALLTKRVPDFFKIAKPEDLFWNVKKKQGES